MIPNWFFKSPLWYYQVFLLPWTHLNPSTCPLTMLSCQYRRQQRTHSCFLPSPRLGTALIIYPPPPPTKDQSAIAKLPWHISLSRISNTWWKTPKFPWNGRRFEWELGPVPALSYVQNCGPVDIMAIASSQCKALFGLFSLNRNKSFVIQLS